MSNPMVWGRHVHPELVHVANDVTDVGYGGGNIGIVDSGVKRDWV